MSRSVIPNIWENWPNFFMWGCNPAAQDAQTLHKWQALLGDGPEQRNSAIFLPDVPVVEFRTVCAYDPSLSFWKYRISE